MDEMNPTCREIEGLLSPYLDRELDPLVARRVDEHVSSCPVCSDALATMREAGRVLAASIPLRSEAEWEALALRVEMAIDREEARAFQEAAEQELILQEASAHAEPMPAMAMRTMMDAAPPKAERAKAEKATRGRGFGWWAYGSGALAAAMLVLLLWPWLKNRVEEGPPAPSRQTTLMDESAGRKEAAPSTAQEKVGLSAREPASTGMPEKATATDKIPSSAKPEPNASMKRNAASPAERKLTSSARGEAPATLDTPASRVESGATKQFAADQSARQQSAPPAAPALPQQKSFSQQKTKAGSVSAPAPPTKQDAEGTEQALQKSAPSGSAQPAPNGQESQSAEERESPKKVRAVQPQPISKSESSPVWRPDQATNGFRAKNGPAASDTPPPPMIKHFSETEWAEMGELQTQEALKAGTEKSLAEATQVLEGFLKEYPHSVFRTQTSANLLRTTSALVQLNPNFWCEKAVAALDNWKLEKPSPAINVDAEVATIQGRCLK